MDDFLDKIKEDKKFLLNFYATSGQQLILQRFQSLTTISAVGFAVAGVVISVRPELILNIKLALISLSLLILAALISLGRHLYLLRTDISGIVGGINKLKNDQWPIKSIKEKDFKPDYWPEILFFVLIIGVVFFILSLLNFNN